MCLTFDAPAANLDAYGSRPVAFRTSLRVLRRAMGAGTLKSSKPGDTGMTTVDAITAGSGDTYRSNGSTSTRPDVRVRAGLQRDCAQRTRPGEEWQTGAPPGPTTAHTGGRSGGRGCPSASVAVSCATPATANGATTSTSARNGGPGRPAGAKVGHRKLAGVPKAEVVGLPNEKVTETSETRLPSSGPNWREVSRK